MTSEKIQLPAKVLGTIVLVSVLGGAVGGAAFQRFSSVAGSSTVKSSIDERHYIEESDSITAIEKVVPAVISIVATKDLQVFQQSPNPFSNDPFFRQFFGQQIPQQNPQQNQAQPETKRQQVSGGTGFIVSADGLAVTNKHVVTDTAADYTAVTREGKKYDVEIISRDPVNDVAVVQLHEIVKDEDTKRKTGDKKNFGDKPSNMIVVRLGDSAKLKVGQKVLAIGNARGEYENSVTAGIVSATGRQIEASDKSGGGQETLTGLIQTDAAINFGNSGGPLINADGEVIGINTAVDTSATGVGFALPINQVKPALESVKKFGKIVRPVLGVSHEILTKERAAELKIKDIDYGALIIGDRSKKEFGVVDGSPAEKAGLKLDDIILEVDGEKVTSENTLQTIVQKHQPGDTIKLKVWRDEKTFEVSVMLDERKEQ